VPWLASASAGSRHAAAARPGALIVRKLNFALAILAYVLVVYATF